MPEKRKNLEQEEENVEIEGHFQEAVEVEADEEVFSGNFPTFAVEDSEEFIAFLVKRRRLEVHAHQQHFEKSPSTTNRAEKAKNVFYELA